MADDRWGELLARATAVPLPAARRLTGAEVFQVAGWLEWEDRASLSVVCRLWTETAFKGQNASWRTAFVTRYGGTATAALLEHAASSVRGQWFTCLQLADALRDGVYVVLVEADQLLGEKWAAHVSKTAELQARVEALRKALPDSCTSAPVRTTAHRLGRLTAIAPYPDLWAAASEDLPTLEAKYLPTLRHARPLKSFADCNSTILVTVQGALHKVVGLLQQETGIDLTLKSGLKDATFRELIDLPEGLPEKAASYGKAWEELQGVMKMACDVAGVVNADTLVLADRCVSGGSVCRGEVASFLKTVAAMGNRLLSLKEKLFDFVVVPLRADLARILEVGNELLSLSETVETAESYYMSPFVCEHYPEDAQHFRHVLCAYRHYVSSFLPGAAFFDVLLSSYSLEDFRSFRGRVEVLDRRHVITASVAAPELFFLPVEEVRRKVLLASCTEAVPSSILRSVLPFSYDRCLDIVTRDGGIFVGTPFSERMHRIPVSNGTTPEAEKDADEVWSIHGVKKTALNAVESRCPEGVPLYNTAPLWIGLVAKELRRMGHRTVMSGQEFPSHAPHALRQVAVAVRCTAVVAAASSPEAAERALPSISALAASSPAVGAYYTAVLRAISLGRPYPSYLQYIVRPSPLSPGLSWLSVGFSDAADGDVLRYGFGTWTGEIGSVFSCRMPGVDQVLSRLCTVASFEKGAVVLCLDVEPQPEQQQQEEDEVLTSLPLELVASALFNTLGRPWAFVNCAGITEQQLTRSFVAASASGWGVVLAGVNLVPADLADTFSSCMELLAASVRNGWASVPRWPGWPVGEMPCMLPEGYAAPPVVLASLERSPLSPYRPSSSPADPEELESFMPWKVVQHLEVCHLPRQPLAPYLAAQLTDRGLHCTTDDVARVWRILRQLPRGCALGPAFVRLLHSLDSDTKHLFARLLLVAEDFNTDSPLSLRFAPDPGGLGLASPFNAFLVVLDLLLSSVLPDEHYAVVRDQLGAPAVLPHLQETIECALTRHGYTLVQELRRGSLSLLILSYYFPVSLVVTSSPQQEFVQGLSVLIKKAAYASLGYLVTMDERSLLVDKEEGLGRAVKECLSKRMCEDTVGWVVVRLSERSARNKDALEALVKAARDGTAGKELMGAHTRLILVVDRQFSALEALLPFVLLLTLSFDEKTYPL